MSVKLTIKILAGVVAVLVLLVGAVYLWPLGSDHLQSAPATTLSFEAARDRANATESADVADPAVTDACRTNSLIHPAKAAKAVVMLHGYTDCPKQFGDLAQMFYSQGYNVYVPRAPRHGVTDPKAHAQLEADELVDYANEAMTIASGLGDEVGVIGISGGGVLATWLAEYRPDVVARLLVLSPFYSPSPQQAPAWQVTPLIQLYGRRLVPDHFNSHGFSFAALSQYLRIARNYRDEPTGPKLRSVALVTSLNDTFIDFGKATDITGHLAEANSLTPQHLTIPADWNIGHDTVDPAGLGTHTAQLEKAYLDLYEGRPASA